MICNVGHTDSIVRITLSVTIAGLGLYFQSWWGLIAIVPLATGLSLFCPIYKIFGLITCSTKSVQ
ncbi:MAG: DUF2892 domain-containing protein [Chitinophagaceae bacterium]|nr:DUF2892 domain-containing protein [Chitinophagaceae bacterium]